MLAQVLPGTAVPAGRRRIGRLDLALAVACLGLLATFAVPRQQALTAQSQRTEVGALTESVRSAAGLAHALWQAQGQPAVLELERGAVRMVNGYPAAGDLALLLEPPETMAFNHAAGDWQHRDRDAASPCGVSYRPPAQGGSEPLVRVLLSGCR